MSEQTFSVTCGTCKTVHRGVAEDIFAYIAKKQVEGWDVPDATERRPIACPACKAKNQ